MMRLGLIIGRSHNGSDRGQGRRVECVMTSASYRYTASVSPLLIRLFNLRKSNSYLNSVDEWDEGGWG